MATSYIVLKRASVPENTMTADTGWHVVTGAFEGVSAPAAIKAAAEKSGNGEYVAVPSRSWQPVRVQVEQKTEVKFT